MKNILVRKSRFHWIILTTEGAIHIDMQISLVTGKRKFDRSFFEGCHWGCFQGTLLFRPLVSTDKNFPA